MFADRVGAERVGQLGASGAGVCQRLDGAERLRDDDEQRCLRIEPDQGLVEVGRVDVGNELEGCAAVGMRPQGLVCHGRPEVRSADTDVDHRRDRLAGGPDPLVVSNRVGEDRHLAKHLVDLSHDVDPVHHQAVVGRSPQRGVKHRTILGGVDPVASEHGIALACNIGRLGHRGQQLAGLGGDAVL